MTTSYYGTSSRYQVPGTVATSYSTRLVARVVRYQTTQDQKVQSRRLHVNYWYYELLLVPGTTIIPGLWEDPKGDYVGLLLSSTGSTSQQGKTTKSCALKSQGSFKPAFN